MKVAGRGVKASRPMPLKTSRKDTCKLHESYLRAIWHHMQGTRKLDESYLKATGMALESYKEAFWKPGQSYWQASCKLPEYHMRATSKARESRPE